MKNPKTSCVIHTHSGRYGYFVLLLFLMGLPSCIGDSEVSQSEDSLKLKEARRYYETQVRTVQVPSLGDASCEDELCTDPSHHHGQTKASSKEIVLEPQWNKAVSTKTATVEVQQIPLKGTLPTQAVLFHVQDGKRSYKLAEAVSYLVIEKNSKDGSVRHFITTAMGDSSKGEKSDNPYLYTGNRKSFEGFMIFSDEKGHILWAQMYSNGQRIAGELGKVTDEIRKEQSYQSFAFLSGQVLTKSGDYWLCYECHHLTPDSPLFNGMCEGCGRDLMLHLNEAVVTGDSNNGSSYDWPFDDEEGGSGGNGGEGGEGGDGSGSGGNTNPPPPHYTVSLSASPQAGGTVSGGGSYEVGSQIAISASANYGYMFVDWTGSSSCTSTPYNITVNENKSYTANFITEDAYYTQLGEEGLDKMISDLESGNVSLQKATPTAGGALLSAFGFGIDANSIILSGVNFLKQQRNNPFLKGFGYSVGGLGVGIGITQSIIIVCEGNYSTGEVLTLVSTALNTAGLTCAVCGAFPVAGVLGIAGGVVGLVSMFFSEELPREMNIQLENGTTVHIYLIPVSLT